MLDGIQIPNCQPKELRVVAEKIMSMVMALDYSLTDYNSVTELDKKITVDYWCKFDDLEQIIGRDGLSFTNWFIHKATEPELISRSMRWLISHNYLIIKDIVRERAVKASEHFSNAVGRK
jgi:hypothetical protein